MRSSSGQLRVIRFFERLPLAAGLLVVTASLGSLVQWQRGGAPHATALRGAMSILPIPAVLIGMAGLSLILLTRPGGHAMRAVAAVLAALVLVATVVQAASWAAGRDLGLDLLLFRDAVLHAQRTPPGRMAVNSIAALLLEAGGLLALYADERDGAASARWFAYGAMAITALAIVGYAFGVPRLYAPGPFAGMALPTAVVLLVLAIGTAFVRRSAGLPALLTDPGAAGSVARRLVPAAVLVPFLLGWARIFGERQRIYDTAFGVSLYVVATVVIFLWTVSWAARMARESDRTRQALLEREQAARAAAEDANLAKSNFLAVMSHELRTPLSAIIGYEELLADGITGPVNEAQRHQLGRVKASAQHLLHLIDQILTFSRIDAGREVIRLEDIEAGEVADDAAMLVAPLAQEKGLALTVVPAGHPVPMRTDGGKVRQILVNLLSNAVKFTSAGAVTLTVRHQGGTVQYVVCDTGLGIAPEHLDRIFDAFWQAEQPSTRRVGGTGLGLSVTRRLAGLLGGEVSVASTPGVGSSFTVTLPVESVRGAPNGSPLGAPNGSPLGAPNGEPDGEPNGGAAPAEGAPGAPARPAAPTAPAA